MNEPGTAVRVAELTKRFPGVLAVDRLSFEASPGEIFGLVGPDGAGKTTTLRMLAGVLAPDSGSATVAGFDLAQDAERAKQHISYMPQRFGLYEDLTVTENYRFYGDLFAVPRAERERRADELLRSAGLDQFRGRRAADLSGGMKQKLGLVCALIHTPRVLLLDEPTNGVDPVSRRDFWRILYSRLSEGVTIVMATAYLDEAERCQCVALLHRGRLLFCETPGPLKQRLPGETVFVASADPRAAFAALQGADGVLNAGLAGDGVRLLVDRAARRMPDLHTRLEAARVPIDGIEPVAPTIEDVFVSAVQGRVGREGS